MTTIPTLSRPIALCAAAIAVVISAPCEAHVVTHRFDLTSAPLGIFGLEFTTDYLVGSNEIIGGDVVAARMHLIYQTSHSSGSLADAANLRIEFQPPVEGVPIWSVTGADLGWSGTGQFIADPSTTALNLSILDLPPDSFSLWFLRVSTVNGAPLGGAFSTSFIEIDVNVVPAPASASMFLLGMWHRRRRRCDYSSVSQLSVCNLTQYHRRALALLT